MKFIGHIMLEGIKKAAKRENDGKAMELDYWNTNIGIEWTCSIVETLLTESF